MYFSDQNVENDNKTTQAQVAITAALNATHLSRSIHANATHSALSSSVPTDVQHASLRRKPKDHLQHQPIYSPILERGEVSAFYQYF